MKTPILKTKNPFLKIIFGFLNLICLFFIQLYHLFISICKKIYFMLIKSYKYESLYILFVSLMNLFFSILCFKDVQANQLISYTKMIPHIVYILLMVLFSLFALFGIFFYVRSIIQKKTTTKKTFFWIRSISYILTLFLLFYLTDFVVLDFISRFKTVKRPDESTSSYDVMIYFLKSYQINFLEGIKTTMLLALLGTIIGLLLAFILVTLKMLTITPKDGDFIRFLKKIGNGLANIYVTVIRGTPMIVQAFIFYYLVLSIVRPTMSVADYRHFIDEVWTPFRAGLFTVSVNTAAYLTEVLRGGINAVDKGQREAAEALGFNKLQTMIFIIFPQGIKNSLPSIGNEFIINIKDTSVLTLIGVLDLFSVSKNDILGVFSAKSLEAYLIVAIYYLILTYLTSKLLQYFEKKMNMPIKEITSSN